MASPSFNEYPEKHGTGVVFIEQDLLRQVIHGDLGIQIGADGRVWICLDHKALIRFTPDEKLNGD
jgi:hypothetical protein